MSETVYVTQYGVWWRLTAAEWQALCLRALTPQSYDLDEYRRLAARPRHVKREPFGDGRWGYFATRPGTEVKRPLDWSPDDWAGEIEQQGLLATHALTNVVTSLQTTALRNYARDYLRALKFDRPVAKRFADRLDAGERSAISETLRPLWQVHERQARAGKVAL